MFFASGALLADDWQADNFRKWLDGWQVSVGVHMSKFKGSAPGLSESRFSESSNFSKNNTLFSLAISKEIMKSDSGDLLLELSLINSEQYKESGDGYDNTVCYGYSICYTETYEEKLEFTRKPAFFASLYYQFNTPVVGLKPYVGAGLGTASLERKYTETYTFCVDYNVFDSNYCDEESESNSDIASKTVIAYQLALGANYFFNKNIAAGLGYAYRNYGSLKDKDLGSIKMDSSGLFASATYKF
ncbi:MAG: outer membrane beta-barrel protein [Helicobacteraceae bacterium]|jgi:opacity protein-like surface antigen|nr:outer membrane beta-barrel protein [Helicobacteraceae bacterium]